MTVKLRIYPATTTSTISIQAIPRRLSFASPAFVTLTLSSDSGALFHAIFSSSTPSLRSSFCSPPFLWCRLCSSLCPFLCLCFFLCSCPSPTGPGRPSLGSPAVPPGVLSAPRPETPWRHREVELFLFFGPCPTVGHSPPALGSWGAGPAHPDGPGPWGPPRRPASWPLWGGHPSFSVPGNTSHIGSWWGGDGVHVGPPCWARGLQDIIFYVLHWSRRQHSGSDLRNALDFGSIFQNLLSHFLRAGRGWGATWCARSALRLLQFFLQLLSQSPSHLGLWVQPSASIEILEILLGDRSATHSGPLLLLFFLWLAPLFLLLFLLFLASPASGVRRCLPVTLLFFLLFSFPCLLRSPERRVLVSGQEVLLPGSLSFWCDLSELLQMYQVLIGPLLVTIPLAQMGPDDGRMQSTPKLEQLLCGRTSKGYFQLGVRSLNDHSVDLTRKGALLFEVTGFDTLYPITTPNYPGRTPQRWSLLQPPNALWEWGLPLLRQLLASLLLTELQVSSSRLLLQASGWPFSSTPIPPLTLSFALGIQAVCSDILCSLPPFHSFAWRPRPIPPPIGVVDRCGIEPAWRWLRCHVPAAGRSGRLRRQVTTGGTCSPPPVSLPRREMTSFYLFSCFWNGSLFFSSLSGSDPSPSLLCDLPFLHV